MRPWLLSRLATLETRCLVLAFLTKNAATNRHNCNEIKIRPSLGCYSLCVNGIKEALIRWQFKKVVLSTAHVFIALEMRGRLQ